MQDDPSDGAPLTRTAIDDPGPIWDPAAMAPAPALSVPARAPDPVDAFDARFVAIVMAAPPPGFTAKAAHDAKEQALLALLAGLTPVESLYLHKRLANPRPGDAVAAAFGRMVVERRGRILAFVADARRRAALRAAARR